MHKVLWGLTTLAFAMPGMAQEAPTARTEAGAVRGATEGDVASWKGIPFAAAPVGPLRWRAPQPAPPWAGVREATAYAHDCMQQPFGGDAAPLGTPPAEDCLYLNVWKPAAAKAKLPVVLWIYGGGYVNGGSSPPTYSGANLARKGVLVVSFNYRLGRFGTFRHPALTRANEDGPLGGNYGSLDQIAALQWVHRNIAEFGGDPANVTIMGESAGGGSVHMLLTSPRARGLAHRAVIMSGGDGHGLGPASAQAVEAIGADFIAAKGIAAADPQALAKMRALSAEEVTDGLGLMRLFQPGKRDFSSPYVDAEVSPDVTVAYETGAYTKVPIMIGATSADIGGDTGPMIAGARTLSAKTAEAGLPVYAYRFSYVAQSVATPGAQHASDVPFFFDTQAVKYGAATTPRDNAMGTTISDYVVNFAKAGDPNGADLPRWPRYDAQRDLIMDFAADGKARAGRDPLTGAK